MADKTSLFNKVMVITGASSGFGQGSAIRFGELGARLVLAARRAELLQDVARRCEEAGTRAIAVPTDVSQENEVRELAQRAVSEFGRIDVWVNNANVLTSRKHGELAGSNPWDSGTLEWAAPSPPPHYNFVRPPAATGRYPLWTAPEERITVTGLRTDRREVLVTTLMDAEPHHRYVLPHASIWPFVTAVLVAIGLLGSVFQFGWYYIGLALATVGLLGWFWPRGPRQIEP